MILIPYFIWSRILIFNYIFTVKLITNSRSKRKFSWYFFTCNFTRKLKKVCLKKFFLREADFFLHSHLRSKKTSSQKLKEYLELLTTYSLVLYRYLSVRYIVKLQYRRGLYRLRYSTLLHRRRLRSSESLHHSSGWWTISNRAIECK